MSAKTIGKAAVEWARRQVGKRYVFGTDGPNTYDCSGLVIAAYRHAGRGDERALPHNTVELRHNPHVKRLRIPARSSFDRLLKPGDLVFYYGSDRPEHVALFAGRWRDEQGKMRSWIVQATDPQHGVEGYLRMREYANPSGYGRVNGAQRLA